MNTSIPAMILPRIALSFDESIGAGFWTVKPPGIWVDLGCVII
jgi:hypothetical protein